MATEECPHPYDSIINDHHSYQICGRCGAFRLDDSGGVAVRKWFATLSLAEFYKKNGRMPDPVPPISEQRKLLGL